MFPLIKFLIAPLREKSTPPGFCFHLLFSLVLLIQLSRRCTVAQQRKLKRLAASAPSIIPPPPASEMRSSPNSPNTSLNRPPYLPSLDFGSRRDTMISHHSSTRQSVHLADDSSSSTDVSDIERAPVLPRRSSARVTLRRMSRPTVDQG